MKDETKIKYRISLSLSVLLAMLCAVLSGTLIGSKSEARMIEYDTVQTVMNTKPMENAPLYRIVAENGCVKMLDLKSPEKSRVLEEIDVRVLRKNDVVMLEKGIELYNSDELVSFLEDFGS